MMKKTKFDLCDSIRKYFDIMPFMQIIPWAEQYIDFSEDISAQRNKLDFSLYPYQVDIIKQWQDLDHIKTVTVCAPQQMGKTNLFVVGMLWRMVFAPSQQMIVYPSEPLAVQTNQTKILPLMKHIPQLKAELEKPRSFRSDRFAFSNCISYFSGAGSKIISKSVQVAIGDEVDQFPVLGKLDNVSDLKKRTRSYDSSIMFLVCTPTEENGKIWKSFLKSSQGYWHLRCKKCGNLTMRSCDIHNLQFESEYNEHTKQYEVIPSSIRLICPECGFEHTEDMKREMNINGGYVHKLPQRIKENAGFQIGALASQLPALSWSVIAEAQLEAGKRSDIEVQTTFDNSFRGLPFKRREVSSQDFNNIKSHCGKPPKPQDVEFIFATADTQDLFSPAGMWAVDRYDNLYLLETKDFQFISLTPDDREKIDGRKKANGEPPAECLQDWLSYCWNGFSPLFMVVDRKGHRTAEIESFAKHHKQVFQYSGTSLKLEKFKIQDRQRRVIYVAARQYQADLIYYLYNQKNREQNYIYFPEDISERVIKQISVVQPDKTKKNGHFPQNWQPEHSAVHDYFDVAKLAVFGKQFAIKTLSKSHFKLGEAPSIRRRFAKKLDEKPKEKAGGKSTGWLNAYK